jgi:CheY-like chemotaxis protein
MTGITDFFRRKPTLEAALAAYSAQLEIRKKNFQEIKKRARILVIEDVKEQFPFKFFEDEGYNVRHWESVKSMTPLETGEYDLIVLDIAGVAPLYNAQLDGFAVLENIKKKNPAQLVIAFSGQMYDPEKSKFFKQADDVISKPIDAHRAKQAIDDLLLTALEFNRYWKTIESILHNSGLKGNELERVEIECLTALSQPHKVDIAKHIEPYVHNSEIAVKIAYVLAVLAHLIHG